ncbi:MAG TPA: hypothetical protein VN026_04515 [Bacteroidia bacterium]|jgi:hypothetical protein|nr:hypothetical protein [Bacteroidia bacterium]
MGGQNHEAEIKKESVATEENKATETVVETPATETEKVEETKAEVTSEPQAKQTSAQG